MLHTVVFTAGSILFVYSVWGAVLFLMQKKLLFKPFGKVDYTPGELGLEFEDVYFFSEEGVKLNGWYVPVKGSDFTVLLCHGNGGNIMHRLDTIDIFSKLGVSFFVFDYRGYGNSQGRISEEGTYMDARAAYEWLIKEKGLKSSEIIIFGRSLGGSIAGWLGGKVDCAGVVLESSFTSYVDIAQKFYPYLWVRPFARFSYSTLDYIRKIRVPVLIFHSRNDNVVPFEFSEKLYDAANEPCEFVEIYGGHNDGFLLSGEVYKQGWRKWISSLQKKHIKEKNF